MLFDFRCGAFHTMDLSYNIKWNFKVPGWNNSLNQPNGFLNLCSSFWQESDATQIIIMHCPMALDPSRPLWGDDALAQNVALHVTSIKPWWLLSVDWLGSKRFFSFCSLCGLFREERHLGPTVGPVAFLWDRLYLLEHPSLCLVGW